jgi:hypothetical protein
MIRWHLVAADSHTFDRHLAVGHHESIIETRVVPAWFATSRGHGIADLRRTDAIPLEMSDFAPPRSVVAGSITPRPRVVIW